MDEVARKLRRSERLLFSFATRVVGCVDGAQADDALDEYAFSYADELDLDLALLLEKDRVELVDFGRGACASRAYDLAEARGLALPEEVEVEILFARVRANVLVLDGAVDRILRAARAQNRARKLVVELLAACGASSVP